MNKYDYKSRKILILYVGWLKALRDWFHSAHHVSMGASFSGDHVNLFGKIYQEIEEEIDGAVEKVLGLTDDSRMACPILLNKTMLSILEKYQSPVYDSQEEIVKNALSIETDYLLFLEKAFKALEKNDNLTLGLNDQLAASANQHETYLYLLKRRNKSVNEMMMKESVWDQQGAKYKTSIDKAVLSIVNNHDYDAAYYAIKDIWEDETYELFNEQMKEYGDIDIKDSAMEVLAGTKFKGVYLAGSDGITFHIADSIYNLLVEQYPNIDENLIEEKTYEFIKKFMKVCEDHINEVTYNNSNFDY